MFDSNHVHTRYRQRTTTTNGAFFISNSCANRLTIQKSTIGRYGQLLARRNRLSRWNPFVLRAHTPTCHMPPKAPTKAIVFPAPIVVPAAELVALAALLVSLSPEAPRVGRAFPGVCCVPLDAVQRDDLTDQNRTLESLYRIRHRIGLKLLQELTAVGTFPNVVLTDVVTRDAVPSDVVDSVPLPFTVIA